MPDWSVKWKPDGGAEVILVTGATGVYKFTPGLPKRDIEFVRLARAVGELAKDIGEGGCQHSLAVTVLDVEIAQIPTVRSKFIGLIGCEEGTLTVPDWPAIPHCVIESVVPAEPVRSTVITSLVGNTLTTSKRYNLSYMLTAHQLRMT